MSTPREMIALLETERLHAEAGLAAALAAKHDAVVEASLRKRFESALMCGLIAWRHELDDPSGPLALAVDTALEAVTLLPSLHQGTAIFEIFPVPVAAVIASLVCDEIPSDIVAALPTKAAWAGLGSASFGLAADTALAFALAGEELASTALRALEILPHEAGSRLRRESAEVYLGILVAADAGTANRLLEYGERLFLEREGDESYCRAGRFSGGGENNPHTVDFMLAAALKARGVSSRSLHSWKPAW